MAAALHFPINQRLDRVGNLMVAKAQNAIESRNRGAKGQSLDSQSFKQGLDKASTRRHIQPRSWADHSGDKVMHRSIEICDSETVINHESDVDLIGYEIYRNSDGECIDRYEANPIKEISFQT